MPARPPQSTPRGKLRLYIGTHIVRFITPSITEFLTQHPEASVEMTMGERMPDLIIGRLRPGDPGDAATGFDDDRQTAERLAPCALRRAGDSCSRAARRGSCAICRASIACATPIIPMAMIGGVPEPGGKLSSVKVSGNLVTNSADARDGALASEAVEAATSRLHPGAELHDLSVADWYDSDRAALRGCWRSALRRSNCNTALYPTATACRAKVRCRSPCLGAIEGVRSLRRWLEPRMTRWWLRAVLGDALIPRSSFRIHGDLDQPITAMATCRRGAMYQKGQTVKVRQKSIAGTRKVRSEPTDRD